MNVLKLCMYCLVVAALVACARASLAGEEGPASGPVLCEIYLAFPPDGDVVLKVGGTACLSGRLTERGLDEINRGLGFHYVDTVPLADKVLSLTLQEGDQVICEFLLSFAEDAQVPRALTLQRQPEGKVSVHVGYPGNLAKTGNPAALEAMGADPKDLPQCTPLRLVKEMFTPQGEE